MSNSSVPLERQELPWRDADGAQRRIPAIDERWCCRDVEFPHYFTAFQCSNVSLEAWRKTSTDLSESFRWLLRLPYHRFWSEVILDRTVRGPEAGVFAALDSYLRNVPRVTEPEVGDPRAQGLAALNAELFSRVFGFIVRLSSFRVERTPVNPYHSSLMCGADGLLPITRVMDICAVYLPSNDVVKKMVNSLLSKNAAYAPELAVCLGLIRSLTGRCVASLALSRSAAEQVREAGGAAEVVVQSLAYAVDTLHAVSSLAAAAPTQVLPVVHSSGSLRALAHFAEDIGRLCGEAVPTLLGGQKAVWTNVATLHGRLLWVQTCAVDLLRLAFKTLFLRTIADHKISDDRRKKDALSDYFKELEELQTMPELSVAYALAHPLDEDIHKMEDMPFFQPSMQKRAEGLIREFEKQKLELGFQAKLELEKKALMKASSSSGLSDEARTQLSDLRDMFPQLSPAFLVLVGHQFPWNHELLLDALLNNALPRVLAQFRLIADKEGDPILIRLQKEHEANHDRGKIQLLPDPEPPTSEDLWAMEASSSAPPKASSSAAKLEDSIPETVDGLQKLRVGKKHGGALWSDADRSEVRALGAFYAQHEVETPEDWLEPGGGGGDEYDDEYDDTYDAVDRGMGGYQLDDVKRGGRQMRDTRVQASSALPYQLDDDGDEEDDEDEESLAGVPSNRNRQYAPAAPTKPPPKGQTGPPRPAAPGATTYTGGTQRLRKEQHSAHNKANRARAKYSKGMF